MEEHVFNDLFGIGPRVVDFDPSYRLHWNPHIHKYQVLAKKRRMEYLGILDGCPFYYSTEYDEIVFTWDVQGAPPDQRIIQQLRETDLWRYPGGPSAFYDDMERDSEKRKQKREDNLNDMTEYVANERAPFVKREFDGMPDMRMHFPAVKVANSA